MSQVKHGPSGIGTTRTFLKVGTCSETAFKVLDRAFSHPFPLEEHAALLLAGGLLKHGYQCGLVWGTALAAGAHAYHLLGPGPLAQTKAVLTAQQTVESFRARHRSINCRELTDTDWRNPKQALRYMLIGGPFRCFNMAARSAAAAFQEIETSFSGKLFRAPSGPVSCAALLAEKMGAPDKLVVMAAGLAGGIGLCGGACGALGAAVWLVSLRSIAGKSAKEAFDNPAAAAAIDRFLNSTGGEFLCEKIVGRRFADVDDHAAFLRDGGCAEILQALSAG